MSGLEGSLAQRDFPDLVQTLNTGRCNGILTLTHVGVGRSVTVQEGRLVFASSSSRDDRLGELLLRRGRLSLKQYREAGQAIAPGRRLGTVLVERGILEPKELVKAVVDHTQEIIYGAFQWTEGRYLFQEGQTSPESITLNIKTPELILEGIRRIEAWSRIEKGVGGASARYARSPGYEALLTQLNLGANQLALLENVDAGRDVEGLCEGSALSDFAVCQTLWAFRVIGLVVRMDQADKTGAVSEDEGLGFVLEEGGDGLPD